LSDQIDNRELEDDQMTRVIDDDVRDEEERWIEDEPRADETDERAGWDDEDDPIAPRPRGRLLRPLPLALIAVAIVAAGFLGGVEAQKGSEGSSGAATGGLTFAGKGTAPEGAAEGGSGGEGAAGAGVVEGTGTEAEAGQGLPAFGATEAAASGTVTAVEGRTVYVKESDGTVVAVKVGDGATVTRDSNVAAKKIHPGDTVVVEGSKKGSKVTASSVAATEAGVETTTGFAGPGAAGAGGESEGGAGEEEASVESLFEE
jgi:hypothetical protein